MGVGGGVLGRALASHYASAGSSLDVDFAAFISRYGPFDDDQLAELIEHDGRLRIARQQVTTLDRYVQAVPDLQQRRDPLDAAIDVTLRWMAGGPDVDEASVSALVEKYPNLEEEIRDAATLNNAMLSTAGVREHMTEQTRRNLPQEFGPSMDDGNARYELQELLGRGAFGDVYKAVDRKLSEDGYPALVAVKVLTERDDPERPETGHRLLGRSRLVEEATKARRVNHPNVVRVLDRGISDDGHAYIVYELIDGGDLHRWIEQHHAGLPPRKAAEIVMRIARGVQAAHRAGLVHCDLKPGNIILTGEGEPKVADFGIAIRFEQSCKMKHIELDGDHPIGNMAFISPEQYRMDEGALNVPSDVYAIGGILFMMLTGHMPNGSSLAEIARTHSREDGRSEPPLLRPLRQEIDRDLEAICRRAMAVKPEDRYSSAGELADDLEAWLALEALPWTRPSAMHVLNLWRKRKPAAALTLSLLVVSIVVGLLAAQFFASRAASANLAAAQAEADRELARVEAELAQFRERELTERADSARALLLTLRERTAEQARQGRAVSQLLPMVWNLEYLFEPQLFAHSGAIEDLHQMRVAALEGLVARAKEDGRHNDLDVLLWKNTLVFWYIAAGEIDRAGPILSQLDQHWRQILHPDDRWVGNFEAMQACAEVKSFQIAVLDEEFSLTDAERDELAHAAEVLRTQDLLLQESDAGSPLHVLVLECQVAVYAQQLLNEPGLYDDALQRLQSHVGRTEFPRTRR